MEKQEVKAYYCPFAGQVCQGGITKPIRPVCQFWDSDYSRCSLPVAIGALQELGTIGPALNGIVQQIGTLKLR